MYVVKDQAFLSDTENKKLINKELDLTQIYYVDSENDFDSENYHKYQIGKDIELMW